MPLIAFEDNSLNYNKFGKKSNKCILLLPPGPGIANYFDNLLRFLELKHFVISIDFPGAGISVFKKANINNISAGIIKILEKEKIKEVICIGESYGGSVAAELSKKIKVKKIILIGTGEYFSHPKKIVYSMIFIPALLSRRIRRFYLGKIPSAFKRLFDIDVSYLASISLPMMQNLLERFYEILWYKLDTNLCSETEALLITSINDGIINKKSISKLRNIYMKNKTIILSCGHFSYDKYLQKNKYKILLGFINS
jgi:pimeloyl-ACP methyl ester carboxylesterase